jgi:putative oxidoreductase
MTVLAIVIELGGALALLVGWKTRWAAWLLALFLKNLAIIGGLLFIATFGPGSAAVEKK